MKSPADGPYIVASVDRALVPEIWPHVQGHLARGLKSATETTMAQVLDDLRDGVDRLWIVMRPGQIDAAFLTAVFLDDENEEQRFLGVYGLGGNGVSSWAPAVGRAMRAEALVNGVASVRFCGRKAWARLLDWRVIGEHGGHAVYEAGALS